MHRSWRLLSLAFIALISVSSVCTFPVKTIPQLHSRGNYMSTSSLVSSTSSPVSSNTITIQWAQQRYPSTAAEELQVRELAAKDRIQSLMAEAKVLNGLGLDITPSNPLKIVYGSGGSSFEQAYRNGKRGNASGQLYVDDGVSLDQTNGTTAITFEYQNGVLTVNGTFGYDVGVNVARVKILGVDQSPRNVSVVYQSSQVVGNAKRPSGTFEYDKVMKVVDVSLGIPFDGAFASI
ncbi:hypothetical protein GGU10DRAFT_387428 [Lentinula aff. detonsa]|uniref:Uncharacterized protein n=1 Tax=Lentinula aff. detonsa TaxID=2804958 RepID=A0AA38KGA3_9AGAR|nr:hypothetical protein GGU10DRAFT_387428 [Lentinula aff. detonsa]